MEKIESYLILLNAIQYRREELMNRIDGVDPELEYYQENLQRLKLLEKVKDLFFI